MRNLGRRLEVDVPCSLVAAYFGRGCPTDRPVADRVSLALIDVDSVSSSTELSLQDVWKAVAVQVNEIHQGIVHHECRLVDASELLAISRRVIRRVANCV